jgi:ribosomal protein S18 acetylase RimI-like enzyme
MRGRFSKLVEKEVEYADPHEDRGLSIATVVAGVLIGSYFVAHQAHATGFFTSTFGTPEMLLLYGTLLYMVVASALIVVGQKNLSRDLDLGGLFFATVALAWLLVVFPFDLVHLADMLPDPLRFLVQWISDDIARVLIALGVIVHLGLAVASTILRVAVYKARVRRVGPAGAREQVTDAPPGEGATGGSTSAGEARIVIRDYRPEDRDAAIGVLAASFQGFGPVDQVVGDDDKAPGRRRSMYEMALKEGTKQSVIVAERDGGIEGVLTYADRPDCIPSARDSLAAVRIAGPRLLTLIRDFRMVGHAHPRTPHRHLLALGVRPEAQGRGIGGLLTAEHARRCDEAGLESYLETTRWADPAKRAQERLYERHGFAVAEVVPMTDGWSMVTMKRPAAATSGG